MIIPRATLLLLSALAASSASAAPAATAETRRTNVLLIAVDDLATALGCYGHPVVRTPHLDRLAATGVRFDRAYCQLPLCNPSRASLLTGLRPDTTRVYDLVRHFREEQPGVVTLPQLFRNAGWFTARVGKIFHYGVPGQIGTNGLDDAPSWDQVVNPRGRDVAEQRLIINPTPERPLSRALSWLAAEGSDEEQTDGLIATEAIRLLEDNSGRPFFVAVGFLRPHTPYVAPRHYFDLYAPGSVALPSTPSDDLTDIPAAAFSHTDPDPNYGLPEATCRESLRAYYACVSFVDAQIGRVLEALDRLELSDRTVVALWSDHGYHLGEHGGMWQKRSLFEESARAPLLIRAPGLDGNGRPSRRIVEFIDIYPTLADLAGLVAPPGVAGRSLRPLLENPDRAWDGAAFTQIVRPGNGRPFMGRSIRTERWRYTEWDEGRLGTELYDHDADPHEWRNLAADRARQAEINTLRARLAAIEGSPPPTSFRISGL